MKMNLPNKLTLFRMILVPVFVIVAYLPINDYVLGFSVKFLLLDLIFIIASLTDQLDGYIARKTNQVTTFGKFLDPIADKVLVLSALVMMCEFKLIPAWIPVIVLTREFLVSGFRLVAAEKGTVIAASIWGKIKTATTMVAIILILLSGYSMGGFLGCFKGGEAGALYCMPTGIAIINGIGSVLMVVAVIATIFSGWDYLKGRKRFIKIEYLKASSLHTYIYFILFRHSLLTYQF